MRRKRNFNSIAFEIIKWILKNSTLKNQIHSNSISIQVVCPIVSAFFSTICVFIESNQINSIQSILCIRLTPAKRIFSPGVGKLPKKKVLIFDFFSEFLQTSFLSLFLCLFDMLLSPGIDSINLFDWLLILIILLIFFWLIFQSVS